MMTTFPDTIKSPIVILEKLPICPYIKEELIISDVSDDSENESKYIINESQFEDIKPKFIEQKPDCQNGKLFCSSGLHKLQTNKALSNTSLHNMKSPKVVLERLSIKLEPNFLIKNEMFSCKSEYDDYKQTNINEDVADEEFLLNKVKVECKNDTLQNENKMPELKMIKKSESFEYPDNSKQSYVADPSLLFDISNDSNDVILKPLDNTIIAKNERPFELISDRLIKKRIDSNEEWYESINYKNLIKSKGYKMKLFVEKCNRCNKAQTRVGDKISNSCDTCEATVYYECLICGSPYKYPAGIYTHISVKHLNDESSKPAKCQRCGIQFKAHRNMKEHLRYCKVLPYLKCEFCSMMAKRKSCLRKHLLIKHKNDVQTKDVEHLLQKIVENSQDLKLQAVKKAEIKYGGASLCRMESFPFTKYIKLFCKKCNISYEKQLGIDQRSCYNCGTQIYMQCLKCESKYKFRSSMVLHLKSKCALNSSLMLHCNNCNYITSTKQRLKRHIYRRHMLIKLEDYFNCKKCGKGYKFKEDLRNHQLKCKRSEEFICDFCKFKTNNRVKLKQHIHNTHNLDKLHKENKREDVNTKIVAESIITYCSKCKTFMKPIEKVTKCQYCKTPIIYRCVVCNLQHQKYVRMRIHIIRNHGKKIYPCSNGCGVSFAYKYDLRQHLKFCGTKPKIQCDQCPFKTKYKYALLAHKRHNCSHIKGIKTNVKKILSYCCHYCGKSFKNKIQKMRHVKSCTKSASFLFCDHCSFRTITKNLLINHIQSKHGARIFRGINAFHCQNCIKVFKNYFVYSKHIEDCRYREKKM